MAIFVNTDSPSDLVNRIKAGIDNHTIETWLYDNAGDFTHDTDQWRFHAWMTPIIEEKRVVFGIICRKDRNLSIAEYAIYHGRFLEMLLRHFDKICKNIEVTSLASKYDIVDKG